MHSHAILDGAAGLRRGTGTASGPTAASSGSSGIEHLDRGEIRRAPGSGSVSFLEHVGVASTFELIEYFFGVLLPERQRRDPMRKPDVVSGESVDRTEVSRELGVGRAWAVDFVWRPGELVEDDVGHIEPA